MLRVAMSATKHFGGLIAGHDLGEWWRSVFSDSDRSAIAERLNAPLSAFAPFDSGPARLYHLPVKVLLTSIASWFSKDENRHWGRAFMVKAEASDDRFIKTLDRHFMYNGMIQFYYRCRNDGPEFLPLCIARCREMIDIAPDAAAQFRKLHPNQRLPVHSGYGRLSWLLRKSDPAESARLKVEGESAGWIVSI